MVTVFKNYGESPEQRVSEGDRQGQVQRPQENQNNGPRERSEVSKIDIIVDNKDKLNFLWEEIIRKINAYIDLKSRNNPRYYVIEQEILIEVETAFKTKISSIVTWLSSTKPESEVKVPIAQKERDLSWKAPRVSWGSRDEEVTVETVETDVTDNVSSSKITKEDLLIFKLYLNLNNGFDSATKATISLHIDWIDTWITSYPYLKDNPSVIENVKYLWNVLLWISAYRNEELANYESKRKYIMDNSKDAREALVVANWLKDGLFWNWDTFFDADPSIQKIDDNIEENLLSSDGELKTAEELKTIWLELCWEINLDNKNVNKDLLNKYMAMLDRESIDILMDRYHVSTKDEAFTKFKEDILTQYKKWFQKSIDDIEAILKTDNLEVNIWGQVVLFTTIQERNFALTSSLYFIKWFAEDPESWVDVWTYFGMGVWKTIFNVLWVWPQSLIWNLWQWINWALALAVATYHIKYNLMQKMGTADSRLQKQYNELKADKLNEFYEANTWLKDRWVTLDTIIERIRIEVEAWTVDKTILLDLEKFKKTYFTISNDNVFYSKLFKTLHGNVWVARILNGIWKFFFLPSAFWISENILWKPIIRWRPNEWLLKYPRIWVDELSWMIPDQYSGYKYSIKWSLNGKQWLDLWKIAWSFKDYLKDFAEKSKPVIERYNLKKLLKDVKLWFDPALKNKLEESVRKISESITITDNSAKENFENTLKEISDRLKAIESFSLKSENSDYKSSIETRLKEIVDNIEKEGTINNFNEKLEQLEKEILNVPEMRKKIWKIGDDDIKQKIRDKINEWILIDDKENGIIDNMKASIDKIVEIDTLIRNNNVNWILKKEFLDLIWKSEHLINEFKINIETLETVRKPNVLPKEVKDKLIEWDKIRWDLVKNAKTYLDEYEKINIKPLTKTYKQSDRDLDLEKLKKQYSELFDNATVNNPWSGGNQNPLDPEKAKQEAIEKQKALRSEALDLTKRAMLQAELKWDLSLSKQLLEDWRKYDYSKIADISEINTKIESLLWESVKDMIDLKRSITNILDSLVGDGLMKKTTDASWKIKYKPILSRMAELETRLLNKPSIIKIIRKWKLR